MSLLGSSRIENHPDGTGNINAIVNGNWNTLNEMFNPANGLTASQTTTVVTASAAIFIADMVGATIRFTNGKTGVISAVTDSTHATVTASQTVASQNFEIYRADVVQTPLTALARALTKKARMIAADDGLIPVWSHSTQRFVLQSVSGLAPVFQTLSPTTGTVNLNPTAGLMALLNITGNVTFTTSSLYAGALPIIIVKNSTGSSFNFTFPASWKWGNTIPTAIAAGKVHLMSLRVWGTTDSEVIVTSAISI